MDKKKDVLEYLRNQQKAAEIEAKINGVNIWVLLGALALVGWQLISVPSSTMWSDHELIARLLVVAVTFHLFTSIVSESTNERDELRLSRTSLIDNSSRFLVIAYGALITTPNIALMLQTKTFLLGPAGVSVIGFAALAFGIVPIYRAMFPLDNNDQKFPKPTFEPSKQVNIALSLIFIFIFIAVLTNEILLLKAMQTDKLIAELKPMVLLVALYVLLLLTVSRKLRNDQIAWTYELETDVVLGVASPEVAIRRIENRRLGPRLQDFLDRFFDDLDQRFADVDAKLAECKEKVTQAMEVPAQYEFERSARLQAATPEVRKMIEKLDDDCQEFLQFVQQLAKRSATTQVAILVPVLAQFKTRHEKYSKRVNELKIQLNQIVSM